MTPFSSLKARISERESASTPTTTLPSGEMSIGIADPGGIGISEVTPLSHRKPSLDDISPLEVPTTTFPSAVTLLAQPESSPPGSGLRTVVWLPAHRKAL